MVILIELLATQLRNNKKIKGLKVSEYEYLLTQFADDLGLFLDFDQRSWCEVERVFDTFQDQSGMLINYDKTVVYRIGSLRDSNAKFYSKKKLIWTNEPIKLLGLYIAHDKNELFKLNIEPLIEKTEAILKLWTVRGLSLFGKIQVVNTLIASMYVYRLAVIPKIPEIYHKRLDKIINDFIWDKKRAKMSQKIITGLKINGGGGLVNMRNKEKSLKLQWVSKIKDNRELYTLANEALGNKIGNLLWQCNLNKKDILKEFLKDNFWRDVLIDWMDIVRKSPENVQEVISESLWYNSHIRVGKTIICYETLFKEGINKIKDLLDENNQILSYEKFKEKCQSIKHLQYYSLISAIPHKWKDMLRSAKGEDQMVEHIYYKYAKADKPSKLLYYNLMFDETLLTQKALKLSEEVREQINSEQMVKLIRNIPQTTISVKLRSFQYKLLMRRIITKKELKLYGIIDNDLCSNCNTEQGND